MVIAVKSFRKILGNLGTGWVRTADRRAHGQAHDERQPAPAVWDRFLETYLLASSDHTPAIVFEAGQRYHSLLENNAPADELEGARLALESSWEAWEHTASEWIRVGRTRFFGG